VILLFALAGCAPDSGAPTFQSDVEPLLRTECSMCHRGGDLAEAGLDLRDDAYAALIGVTATQSDLALVEPGDHLLSYLWHKMNGTQGIAGGSGTTMPVDGLLDPEEVALVAAWIDAGAPP
jgi:hypothetical protein